MTDCIFCKIAQKQIPSKIAYEDDAVIAFYDQDPQAPVHVLVIPKEHIASAMEIAPENSAVVAKVFEAIPKIAQELGLENGFRVVNNCGKDGMQTGRPSRPPGNERAALKGQSPGRGAAEAACGGLPPKRPKQELLVFWPCLLGDPRGSGRFPLGKREGGMELWEKYIR